VVDVEESEVVEESDVVVASVLDGAVAVDFSVVFAEALLVFVVSFSVVAVVL
jgi:hypothetical protein